MQQNSNSRYQLLINIREIMRNLKDRCHLPTDQADAEAEQGDLSVRFFENNQYNKARCIQQDAVKNKQTKTEIQEYDIQYLKQLEDCQKNLLIRQFWLQEMCQNILKGQDQMNNKLQMYNALTYSLNGVNFCEIKDIEFIKYFLSQQNKGQLNNNAVFAFIQRLFWNDQKVFKNIQSFMACNDDICEFERQHLSGVNVKDQKAFIENQKIRQIINMNNVLININNEQKDILEGIFRKIKQIVQEFNMSAYLLIKLKKDEFYNKLRKALDEYKNKVVAITFDKKLIESVTRDKVCNNYRLDVQVFKQGYCYIKVIDKQN